MSLELLLPQVAVVRLSSGVRQELADILTEVVNRALEVRLAKFAPPAALKAADAAAHLGISRSHFYQLLRSDPHLGKLAFTAGRRRLFPIVALDEWMRAKQCTGGLETA